jgi:hypothetical protein
VLIKALTLFNRVTGLLRKADLLIRCLRESCERTTKGGRGLRKHHYQIQYRARVTSGEDTSRFVTVGCKEEGCNSDHLAKGFCGIHYRAVNKDRLRTVNQAWYEANKEIRLAQIKEYREINKDRVAEWNKNWWNKHPHFK